MNDRELTQLRRRLRHCMYLMCSIADTALKILQESKGPESGSTGHKVQKTQRSRARRRALTVLLPLVQML